jgi:hypothetical protein
MKEIPVCAMEKILSNFFLECKADLDDPKPINDEERFDLVLDGLNVTTKSLDELRELGVFSCGVHFGHRQLDLMGTLLISEFNAKISDVWGFDSPENFFRYGAGTVPVGKLD